MPVGVSTYNITTSNGDVRYYKLYAPNENMSKRPVLLYLHGGGQSMWQIKSEYMDSLPKLAQRENILIIAPNGVNKKTGEFDTGKSNGLSGRQQRWNDDRTEDLPIVEKVDDVAFLTELLDYIHSTYKTSREHTYVAGPSNGGFMTLKLLLDAPEYFAAGAAGISLVPNVVEEKIPSKPTPLILWVSTKDPLLDNLNKTTFIPEGIMSPNRSLKWWASHNNAKNYKEEMTISQIGPRGCYTTLERYEGEYPVYLYRSYGSGHTLPTKGTAAPESWMFNYILGGPQCRDIDFFTTIWDFFKKFNIENSNNVSNIKN